MIDKKYLDGLIKESGNEYAKVFTDVIDPDKFYSTGSYSLNALIQADINKGLMSNKRLVLAGQSGVGKCMDGEEKIEIYVSDEDYEKFWKDRL